jgi:uncharacterized protein involved in tolerance to divalent cations
MTDTSATAIDAIVLIYAVIPDKQDANHIAAALLSTGAIARAQYWSVTELEMWGGEPQSSESTAMIMATRASLAERAITEAPAIVPKGTPTFVVLDAIGGLPVFRDVVLGVTQHPT